MKILVIGADGFIGFHLVHALKVKAKKIYKEMQKGDVIATMADIDASRKELEWQPKTAISDGLRLFVQWFFEYHKEFAHV